MERDLREMLIRHAVRLGSWIAVLTLVAIPAAAADNGFYVGGSAGQSSFSAGDLATDVFDGDATGYKVFGGYRFLTLVSVEASYVDFGDIEGNGGGPARYQADVNGLTLQAVGYLPLGIADVFVKGGLFGWEADITSVLSEASSTMSTDGSDLVYGAGVQFRIRSFAVRAEIEYFDIESVDQLYMVSVGVSYTF